MKEKEQTSICVDEEKNGTNAGASSKDVVDDSCFKAPLLLPPRKGVGRRRGSSVRNGQATNVDATVKQALASMMQSSKEMNKKSPSDAVSCSCSQSYVKTLLAKDKIKLVKESIIDDFSLLMFRDLGDLQTFEDELRAVKAKEEAEEKRRKYEQNVRLGLIKKKGRKSKAQLEKERKLERRRLRREKKEQRRQERKEKREREAREGTSMDSEERRIRRERRRERKERREREADGDEKKERKRKLKDNNGLKKSLRQQRQSLSRTEAVQNEAYIEGNGVAAAGTIWMNDTGISVCSTNNATASNLPAGMLKRPSDLLIDATTFEKRIKLEANLPDDHKSSMIGIASKTDSMTKMSASPPRSGAVGTTRANAIVSNIDLSIATGNHGQNSCNGQLPRAADMRDPASVETTHPVDPGHDVPSTSVVAGHHHPQQLAGVTAAPSVNNMQALSSVNSLTSEPPGISVGVLTSTGRSEQPTSVTTGSSSSSVVTGATVLAASTVPASPAGAPMLDPFRQAFFGGNSLAALNAAAAVAGSAGSTVGAADFSNLFFHTAPPNAAAAFPFLAAQILQQQHQHQQAQQSMSIGQGSAPPTTVPTGAQPSTSTAPSVGCIQFPSGAALAPQLANAALLGRALPTAAATQPLSVKTKQGRWCGMHIKIAYDILSKKERRSTPQPSVASQSASLPAPPQNSCNLNTMRNAGVTAPFCPPSTSNASMTSLGSGLPSSFPVLAQTGALPSPFSLPFQQFADTSKLVRRSGTPKQSQNRSATTITRSPSSASGLHLQLSGTGNTASGLIAPSLAAGAGSTMPLQGSLPNPLSGVLGSSLPLTPNLPSASASLTNGTSEAAAQAAMFAALQNVQQNAVAAFPNGSLSATPYLLSSAAAPQPHPLSAITSQAQNIYQSQRLFDPSMTAAMFQQMQSMEALRQSAASAQMNSNPAGAGSHVPVSGAPQGAPPQSQPPPSSIDLVRMQMEQQMMDRYMIALSSASGIGSNNTMTASSNFELMRQQLFAAHMRQQSQQTSLEALLEMQRQQQQQLFNVSRGLPSSYTLAGGAPPGSIPGSAAAAAAAAAGLPQGLGAAAGLFNSNLMALGNAANLQQALYNGKNPYSNTLEQLARQKREDDIIQSGR